MLRQRESRHMARIRAAATGTGIGHETAVACSVASRGIWESEGAKVRPGDAPRCVPITNLLWNMRSGMVLRVSCQSVAGREDEPLLRLLLLMMMLSDLHRLPQQLVERGDRAAFSLSRNEKWFSFCCCFFFIHFCKFNLVAATDAKPTTRLLIRHPILFNKISFDAVLTAVVSPWER